MMKKKKEGKKKDKNKEQRKNQGIGSKIFLVLGYILSLFFVIMGIAMAVDDFSNSSKIISGILYFAAGVIIFPKIKLKAWIKGLIFIALIILAEII